MNRKSIGYLNTLKDVYFLLAHQDILSHARKMTNQRISGVVSSYGAVVGDVERFVQVPGEKSPSHLNEDRLAAYTMCHKAVCALDNAGEHAQLVAELMQAFGTSMYRERMATVDNTLDRAERVASEISGADLDVFSLRERMEKFVNLNREYKTSCEVVEHNRKIHANADLHRARLQCGTLYRCIQEMALRLAQQGDVECKTFLDWVKAG